MFTRVVGLTILALQFADCVDPALAFKRATPTATQAPPMGEAAMLQNMFSSFDVDGDGLVSRDEVEQRLPYMNDDPSETDGSTLEQRVDGFMLMLDEDRNGYGTRTEMKAFIKKMQDMDGRTDRLPVPAAAEPTAKKSKKRKKRRSAPSGSGKSEL